MNKLAKKPLRSRFSINGRATRKEFWEFFLKVSLIGLAVVIGSSLAGALLLAFGMMSPTIGYYVLDLSILIALVGALIVALLLLGIIVPLFCASVRRLHDVGMSAWWMFWTLIPVVGTLCLLGFFLTKSGPDNKYGPSPICPVRW